MLSESIEKIFKSNFRARRMANALLPLAVVPMIAGIAGDFVNLKCYLLFCLQRELRP